MAGASGGEGLSQGTRPVLLTVESGVARVTLNRPERRNALSIPLLTALRAALQQVRDSADVGVLLLSGAGGAFCAGADLKEFADISDEAEAVRLRTLRSRLVEEVLTGLLSLDRPTLAVVAGPAVGGGWALAMACDLCWAAPDATFRLPEVEVGIPLAATAARRLAALVGPVRAAEMVLGAAPYTGQELAALGCVNRVLPAPELEQAAFRFAAGLAARDRRAAALAVTAIRSASSGERVVRSDLLWS